MLHNLTSLKSCYRFKGLEVFSLYVCLNFKIVLHVFNQRNISTYPGVFWNDQGNKIS